MCMIDGFINFLHSSEKLKLGHFPNPQPAADHKKRVEQMKIMYGRYKSKALLGNPADLPLLNKQTKNTIESELVEHFSSDLFISAISTPSLYEKILPSQLNQKIAPSPPNNAPIDPSPEPPVVPPIKRDTFWDDDDDLVSWATNLPSN